MQARLFPAIRALFPHAQIFATTHSPFVVASLGEGVVFPIRPDPKDLRVRGKVEARRLEPGSSLEWVVEEIFAAPSRFVDEGTRARLEAHKRAMDALRTGRPVDLEALRATRTFLLGLNDEVRAIVAAREVRLSADQRARLSPP